MGALQTGVSGILAQQTRMDAIGNNIANANTVGYKSSRVLFSDTLDQVLQPAAAPTETLGGTNPMTLGQGVGIASIDTKFSQGTLQATGRSLDVAVEGDGMLAVTDGTQIYYTRHGALNIDQDGYLVQEASGMRMIALPPSNGSTPLGVTTASTLQIPLGQSIARATTALDLNGNLDAGAATGDTHDVSLRIYDSLGTAHQVTLTFTKNATANTWDVTGTSADGTLSVTAPAQATFDSNGMPTVSSLQMSLALTNPNGATANIDMTATLTGCTQLAAADSMALSSQNGVAAGTLTGVEISQDGSIQGVYSNGLKSPLGQLVTAQFPNINGLESKGESLYAASVNSGVPSFGAPGEAGRGALRSGELEQSNVNLAEEFADMIVTQRSFQASSRVVNTADQMLQELLQIVQ